DLKTLTVRNCTISGNAAEYQAGGIFAGGNLIVTNSTISGNTSGNYGGGIAVTGYAAVGWIITNSTISGNTSMTDGGGIATARFSGPTGGALRIENSTIAGNAARNPFTGQGGGGIARVGSAAGNVTLTSTIVANNNSDNGSLDVLGSVIANFSLIQNPPGSTISGSNNVLGADPKLDPLQNNGGPTPTMALLPGSAAIDVGSNPARLATDQRGAGFTR